MPQPEPANRIQEEFEVRLVELERDHARDLAALRGEFESRFGNWAEEADTFRLRQSRRLAEEATDLAVAIAEKIIRERAAIDRGVLIRTLETALYKVQSERPVVVLVHPEDAVWLESDGDLRERLKIEAVVPDRRVDVGGCRIRTDDAEWDATLKQQLAGLANLVEGSLIPEEETEAPGDPA
jgi:flagellar biosynthesis/type III secretory pathway protein FliH